MKIGLRKTITTFNLKIPGLETELPIPFSGTPKDKEDYFQLKEFNKDDKEFLSKLLVKYLEKRIQMPLQKFLEESNEFYKEAIKIEKITFQKFSQKSSAKILIRMEKPIEQFKQKFYRDTIDYFSDINVNSLSRILNYIIKKELKKQTKRDEREQEVQN